MNCSFSQTFPQSLPVIGGNKTDFVPKIISSYSTDVWTSWFESLDIEHQNRIIELLSDTSEDAFIPSSIKRQYSEKKHAIRRDSRNRWHQDMMIDFCVGLRTKGYLNFMPRIPVQLIQKVDISHYKGHVVFDVDGEYFGEVYHHRLDDLHQYSNCLLDFSRNDGFDSLEHLLRWFSTDFSGKIIHWTDTVY